MGLFKARQARYDTKRLRFESLETRQLLSVTPTQHFENFDVDPGWEKVGSQNFGFSNTNNVGLGQGEIGGQFFRDPFSYYADQIDEIDPDVDTLSLSGTAEITQSDDGNFLLGWFDKDSNLDWAPQHFLGMRSDGTDIYLLGDQGSTLIGSVTVGTSFSFDISYDSGVLRGSINGGPEVTRNVNASQINSLDRFGLVNLQTGSGGANQTAFFDNLDYTVGSTSNWGISINSSPLSAVLSGGGLGTTLSTINVVGSTVPGRLVELEADGDGLFDEGSATADANGEYEIPISLDMGSNTLTVRAQDSGVTRTNTLVVERVSSLPSTVQVFDNFAIDRTGTGSSGGGSQRTESFDTDPGWEKVGTQNFGFSNTNNVGVGQGEMGGQFFRNPLSYYADTIDELDADTDSLLLTGTAKITQDNGGGNFLLGWFDKDSNLGWAPQHFLGMRSDGTDIYLLGDQGSVLIDTVSVGTSFTFEVSYSTGVLRGSINGGTEVTRNVTSSQINPLDRFGLVNLQTGSGGPNQTAFFDDLSYTASSSSTPPADPSFWEGHSNRLSQAVPPTQDQNFGYSGSTNNAGGASSGEIGGRVARGATRAYYGTPITAKSFDDVLSASGTFSFQSNEGGNTGSLIGWFNDDLSNEWRTPSSIAMRLDGNGSTFDVFVEYGSLNGFVDGSPEFATFAANGASHTFDLSYDPNVGNGRITLVIDGSITQTLDIDADHRLDGASFNRFGFWNQQLFGNTHDVFFDDLTIDGTFFNFDTDPGWEGLNNRAAFPHTAVRPLHDFGYSPTSFVFDDANEIGELGGLTYRDEESAFYAADVGNLTLNDKLDASGVMVFESGARSDTGVFVGWFDSTARKNFVNPGGLIDDQPAFLGARIDGPSRFGHGFRAAYQNSQMQGDEFDAETSPRLVPDGQAHDWEIHYDPDAAGGLGAVSIVFDGQTRTLNLDSGHKAGGANFDRFGIFVFQEGGHQMFSYWDDLAFTAESSTITGQSQASAAMSLLEPVAVGSPELAPVTSSSSKREEVAVQDFVFSLIGDFSEQEGRATGRRTLLQRFARARQQVSDGGANHGLAANLRAELGVAFQSLG